MFNYTYIMHKEHSKYIFSGTESVKLHNKLLKLQQF